MKAASINEIKKELIELDSKAVQDLCMRLAKYKKENKELLTYLLFEAHDEAAFNNDVKTEMDELFQVSRPEMFITSKKVCVKS